MATEMIRTARNHPSVIIYGIGNECNTANPEARVFFEGLAGLFRNMDPSRLVSYAALYGNIGSISDIVDVLGINSYWGWYDKIFGGKGLKPESAEWRKDGNALMESIDLLPMRQMLDRVLSENRKNLVLFMTEFGADSVPGFYSMSRDLWSENYHAELLKAIFELSEEYPQIAGTFPFCFSDYRDPSKAANGYWNEVNLKGVVTYDRRKKLAFDALVHRYG
jgi:beta-glucuronidase